MPLCAKIDFYFLRRDKKVSNEILTETENKFVSHVVAALDAVKMYKDPEELNRYRKLFKQNVPLTMRSYVAAYLAKEAILGKSSRVMSTVGFGQAREGRQSFHTGKPKIVLKDDEAQVLFFSVGRRRGIGPKDIITLVMQNVEIPREHIGDIKILENYCFVQIMKENAEDVLNNLNNYRFRGRPLSVSYAGSKEGGTLQSSSQDSISSDESEEANFEKNNSIDG